MKVRKKWHRHLSVNGFNQWETTVNVKLSLIGWAHTRNDLCDDGGNTGCSNPLNACDILANERGDPSQCKDTLIKMQTFQFFD